MNTAEKQHNSRLAVGELMDALRRRAPSIAIIVEWQPDTDAKWDIEEPALDPDDYQAWQSTVKAQAIDKGVIISGSAHLCGTWEKFGDDPQQSNPEISGYLPQMLEEALLELAAIHPGLRAEVDSAISGIKELQ